MGVMRSNNPARGFRLPNLPKPDYEALRWAQEELGCQGQWEVVVSALRLLQLMMREGLDLGVVQRIGQRETVKAVLQAFLATLPANKQFRPPEDPSE